MRVPQFFLEFMKSCRKGFQSFGKSLIKKETYQALVPATIHFLREVIVTAFKVIQHFFMTNVVIKQTFEGRPAEEPEFIEVQTLFLTGEKEIINKGYYSEEMTVEELNFEENMAIYEEEEEIDILEQHLLFVNILWIYAMFTYGLSLLTSKTFLPTVPEQFVIYVIGAYPKLPIFFVEGGHTFIGRFILLLAIFLHLFKPYFRNCLPQNQNWFWWWFTSLVLYAYYEWLNWYYEEISYLCWTETTGICIIVPFLLWTLVIFLIEYSSENEYGPGKSTDCGSSEAWAVESSDRLSENDPLYPFDIKIETIITYWVYCLMLYFLYPISEVFFLDYLKINWFFIEEEAYVHSSFVRTYAIFDCWTPWVPHSKYGRPNGGVGMCNCHVHMLSFPQYVPRKWRVNNPWHHPFPRSKWMWVSRLPLWDVPGIYIMEKRLTEEQQWARAMDEIRFKEYMRTTGHPNFPQLAMGTRVYNWLYNHLCPEAKKPWKYKHE